MFVGIPDWRPIRNIFILAVIWGECFGDSERHCSECRSYAQLQERLCSDVPKMMKCSAHVSNTEDLRIWWVGGRTSKKDQPCVAKKYTFGKWVVTAWLCLSLLRLQTSVLTVTESGQHGRPDLVTVYMSSGIKAYDFGELRLTVDLKPECTSPERLQISRQHEHDRIPAPTWPPTIFSIIHNTLLE